MRKINTLVLFLMFSACGMMQAQIYVNQLAFGSNDGSSWANAFNDLVPAIASAIEGDEIWIALGEYVPTEVIVDLGGGDADTLVTFLMDKNIKLYGGFVGNESSIEARNPLLNATILYGDANNDDRADSLSINRSDNADHIIYATDQVTEAGLIDGFYIFRGGRVSAQAGSTIAGGGIYLEGTPAIRNCLIQQCVAIEGGGLYVEGSGSGSVQIENCGFDNNYAIESGSCVKVLDVASLTLDDCRLTRSLAEEATLYVDGVQNVSLSETVIQENVADYFSAIYVDDVNNVLLKECSISKNHSNVAITVQFEDFDANAIATFDQTRVVNNTSDSISAGVAHGVGNLFLINSLFAGNVSGNPVVFSELASGGVVSINHSILANISAPVLWIDPGTVSTTNSIFHCDENGVFSGAGSITSTGGNICSDNSMDAGLTANGDLPNTDPELINVAGRNYKPGFDSPAKDAAVNSTETVDIDGELRDAFPDIGAFEITASATTQTEIDKTTIAVYPAVTEDAIKVNWESDDFDKVEYQIIDQRGALLQSGLINVKHQSIDVSLFSAGQYQIIFTAEKQRTVRSFIKL